MRTLQEKYNAIQEGKFSKDQFLVEARMQQPQLVTRYNGYNDAVKILKNRGMIVEVSAEESFADYSNDALTDMISNLSRYEGNENEIARIKSELERRRGTVKEAASFKFSDLKQGSIIQNKFSGKKYTVTAVRDKSADIQKGDDGRETEIASLNNYELVKEARLTKKNLADYRYKPTNDMDNYPYEQILRGLRVELETMGIQGTPTAEEYKKALTKVLKNLEKDEIFYTNQLAGNNKKVDLHDKMVDATAKNTVDTFNGMKKIKDLKENTLKEGIKNLIKKVLTENEEDIYEMQGPKSDQEYKSELADYLEDNQIYGYVDMIHDIMTGPDEEENSASLADFLDDHQIYGYSRAIERIYADYPYDQHWMNQPDEDEADDISHPRGYEEASDEESFEDLYEVEDKEADKDMVRKLMAMYETEPSKFERLHKQAQVQASTTKDIKFKHLLSLLDRAKAGALQSLANQDRFEADREGMDESVKFYAPTYIAQKYGAAQAKEIEANIEDEGANMWDLFTSLETPKEVDDFVKGFTMDESVSLKDLLN